jgi:quercetin dioxygenase-like cupin family protein
MLAAATFGAVALHRPQVAKAPAVAVAETPVPATSTVRAEDVVVVNLSYEPGHGSGWHVHPGLHAVYVLSGTLTVYDEACRPRLYGPGESYIGGQSPHMVRNETDADVEMIVTGIEVTGPAGAGSHLPAPAGCPVS